VPALSLLRTESVESVIVRGALWRMASSRHGEAYTATLTVLSCGDGSEMPR